MDDLRLHILGLADRSLMPVVIPEWGDLEVLVTRLSLPERLVFEARYGAFSDQDRQRDPDGYVRWMVRYVIATARRPDDTALFAPEDEEPLMKKAGTAIERLVLAGLKANTVSAEDVAGLGKSYGGAQNGASPSGSPVTSA